MKRLTSRLDLDGYTEVSLYPGVTVGEAICKLSEYESTGLEPEEILTGVELAQIAVALTEKKAEKESPWISVEDRLPDTFPCNARTEYSEAVIVWTDGKKAMAAVWNGSRFLCAADYWEAWGEKITHWMPLPEPPNFGAKMEV